MSKDTRIQMPLWVKDMAFMNAEQECRSRDLKKGSTSYDDCFIQTVNEYCQDALENSFTAHIKSNPRRKNPGTPRISKTFFKELPDLFADTSAIMSKSKDKTATERNLKSAVTYLAQIYVKTMYGLTNKNFEYPKSATEEQQKEVEYNRYLRMYIAVRIAQSIAPDMNLEKEITTADVERLGVSLTNNLYLFKDRDRRRKFVEEVKALTAQKGKP